MPVDGDHFLELGQSRRVAGRDEGEGEGGRGTEFGTHLLGHRADAALIVGLENEAGCGAIHGREDAPGFPARQLGPTSEHTFK
jgi:hypothetical protein